MEKKVKKSPYKNIRIMTDTYNKLFAMKHKGQSFDGFFQEMMDKLEKNGDKPKEV